MKLQSMKTMTKGENLAIGMIAGAIIGTAFGAAAKSMAKPKKSAMKMAADKMLCGAKHFVDGMR